MKGTQGNTFHFTLNGERVDVRDVSPDTTLLDWLRRNGRVGSKCGCAEGDCGACTVALREGEKWRAINSCIALLPMFAGRELLTVEGLAREDGELHPVQRCMVKHGGSQCGYCTPGFVMSMFEGYERGLREPAQIADQLCGNLCRCTGYRPIRDAAVEAFALRGEGEAPAEPARFSRDESLGSAGASPSHVFLQPTSLAELLALKREHPGVRLVAGATEIGVEINKKFARFPQLISTERVAELREVRASEGAWHFGAAATLTEIEEALAGDLPSFGKMLTLFASRQIRNRATLGGNLVTASPIGDSAPVLLSLDASVILASESGERTVALSEFFTGYRRTALRADEVMKTIVVPRVKGRKVAFFKVSKRREMDISIVAAAFCVETDAAGIVTHARMAFGGVAPTPMRAPDAERTLMGKALICAEITPLLRDAFSPIDDGRGSAEYRRRAGREFVGKVCAR